MRKRRFIVKKRNEFWPSKETKKNALVNEDVYKLGKNPIKFWNRLAKQLFWYKKWSEVYKEKIPYFGWFVGGKTNLCYNALDRNVEAGRGNRTALIWVPEPIDEKPLFLSYFELQEQVVKFANVLSSFGLKKGDVVMIYLPMIPQIIISMLACARLGIIHSVVFSAFSSASLKKRIKDCEPKLLVTADGYYRRGELINLKKSAEDAIKGTTVKKVIFVKRTEKSSFSLRSKNRTVKYFWWYKLMQKAEENENREMQNCVPLKSEDIMFILYTSGTTGTPKGVMHSLGGYLVEAYWTAKLLFNLDEKQENIVWCTADIGWITGHTYACYGPLLNGSTTLMYEGSPDWPDFNRFYDIVEKQKVNVLYTAPTLLRILIAKSSAKKYKFKHLKIIGSVGEPIDKTTWLWYFNNIGKKRCPLLDTWWQTETGGILISSLPGIGPFIPCFAGRSFPGTRHCVVNEKGKRAKEGEKGFLVQLSPFAPGMLNGIWKNKARYRKQYWSQVKGKYFTGDGAFQDKHGNFRITGRIDDVLKVAGHRISNAEIENAIAKNKIVVENAIIGKPDQIKGEVPVAFVVLKQKTKNKKSIEKKLQKQVIKEIGPIAKISEFYFVEDLPKTRSGKIMRRIMKSLILKEPIQDVSTLVNPESVKEIEEVLTPRQ